LKVTSIRIEQIYEALFDDEAFAALPELMARAGRGRSALMLWGHHDGGMQVMGASYFGGDFLERYPEFNPVDPWWAAIQARPNELLRIDQHVAPTVFESSVIYNELILDAGDDTFHAMGAAIQSPWGSGALGVHRGRTAGPFEADDQAAFQQALRPFVDVLRVRGELAGERRQTDLVRSALGRVAMAVVTVRSDGTVLDANAAAEAVFARADGVMMREGRLTARTANGQTGLADALARATAAREPAVTSTLVERPGAAGDYLVTVSPAVASSKAAIVMFRDPEFSDPSTPERLRSLFGLSPAEASVAVALSEGWSVEQIAERQDKSPNTVRVQVQALLAKTGLGRQADLVRLVLNLPQSFPSSGAGAPVSPR
jgi:DNA-binding NarL/FixJ family response regulator